MKTDIICKIDEFLNCPNNCENYEEREVCLVLLKRKLAEYVTRIKRRKIRSK
jgi:hypothetical protein